MFSLASLFGSDEDDDVKPLKTPVDGPAQAPSPYTAPAPITAEPPRAPAMRKPIPLADIGVASSGAPSLSDISGNSVQAQRPEEQFGDPTAPRASAPMQADDHGFLTADQLKSEFSSRFKDRFSALREGTPWYMAPFLFKQNHAAAVKQTADELSARSEAVKLNALLARETQAERGRHNLVTEGTAQQRADTQEEQMYGDLMRKAALAEIEGDYKRAQTYKAAAEVFYMPEKVRQGAEGAAARSTRAGVAAALAPSQAALNQETALSLQRDRAGKTGADIEAGRIEVPARGVGDVLRRGPFGRMTNAAWQVAGGDAGSQVEAQQKLGGAGLDRSAGGPQGLDLKPLPVRPAPQAIPLPPAVARNVSSLLGSPEEVAGLPSPAPGSEQLRPPPAGEPAARLGEPAIPTQTATPPEKGPVDNINGANEALLTKAGMDQADANKYARDMNSKDPALKAKAEAMFAAARTGKRFKKRGA